jgi:tight adherence protein C
VITQGISALLFLAAMLLAIGAALELRGRRGHPEAGRQGAGALADWASSVMPSRVAELGRRLDLRRRLSRAGFEGRVEVSALLAAKLGGAGAGGAVGLLAAPAAPGRLSILVALTLPAAGFLAPDALLERRARLRAGALRRSLPDALDLLATAASAGRSPLAGFGEIARGEGPLARELSVLVAETSSGAPQREALDALSRRVPAQELAAMCAVIERSRRYGSPLADQLHDQASALRGTLRRRIEEDAAKAAPKIQLAVALLLVPSVLLMIAAGLLANMDRFLSGI